MFARQVPCPSPHHAGFERVSWEAMAHCSQFFSSSATGSWHCMQPLPGKEVLYVVENFLQGWIPVDSHGPTPVSKHWPWAQLLCTPLGPKSYSQLFFLTPTLTQLYLDGKSPSEQWELQVIWFSYCLPHCCPAWRQSKPSAVLHLFQAMLPILTFSVWWLVTLCRMPIMAFHLQVPLSLDMWQEQTHLRGKDK